MNELLEFVTECDCPGIQSRLTYTYPDFEEAHDGGIPYCKSHLLCLLKTGCNFCMVNKEIPTVILIPGIEQLIEMLGDRFLSLIRGREDGTKPPIYGVEIYSPSGKKGIFACSIRLALIRAVKENLNEIP